MSSRLSLEIRGHARLSDDEKRTLLKLLERAIEAAGAKGELSLSLTDDAELRRLNRQFAGEDHATDVLSFSQQEGDGPKTSALGDIVISVPTARRQMKTSLVDELVHLAVHGLAHLLGFDHATADEERVMFAYETRLREAAHARGPVRRVTRPRRPA